LLPDTQPHALAPADEHVLVLGHEIQRDLGDFPQENRPVPIGRHDHVADILKVLELALGTHRDGLFGKAHETARQGHILTLEGVQHVQYRDSGR